jgi:hypothetical protein
MEVQCFVYCLELHYGSVNGCCLDFIIYYFTKKWNSIITCCPSIHSPHLLCANVGRTLVSKTGSNHMGTPCFVFYCSVGSVLLEKLKIISCNEAIY